MSGNKARVTVTLDPELVRLGNAEVRAGRAASLSDWVNTALAERAAEDKRLRAARRAVAEYEKEFGKVTDDELTARVAGARAKAVRIRRSKPKHHAA